VEQERKRNNEMSVKFEYFPIAGAGEKVRLALSLAGIPFDDIRLRGEAWAERKKTAKYGQLPIMTLPDGKEIYQSEAMLRWAGAQGDGTLYPTDDLETRLKIDEIIGVLGDLHREWSPSIYISMKPQRYGHADDIDADAKAGLTQKLREGFLANELPRFMGYFANFIEESGGKFLAGATITIADCAALHSLSYYGKGIADHVPTDTLDAYPAIKEYIARVMADPKIAAYYASLQK